MRAEGGSKKRIRKPKSGLTPKQRVLARWPDATLEKAGALEDYTVQVGKSREIISRPEGTYSPKQAWADAAKRLSPVSRTRSRKP